MKNKLVSIGKAAKEIGVSIDTLRRWDSAGRLKSTRSGIKGHRYYLKEDIEDFLQDPTALARNWIVAPQGFRPRAEMYCETRDVFQARLESFESKLSRIAPLTTTSLITAVAGEIGNNSYDHNLGNWPDIPGIFFSYSMRNRTVVLADRGLGILATLRRVRPNLVNSEEALKVAFTEILSGRYPEARGNGLKFVRAVIIDNPFTLDFQTGDAHLFLKENDRNVIVEKIDVEISGCFVIIEFESLI
ncbi:MAG TPA: MerR family DNA-binding transcriptional regulator [Patescibacteria group bacterium]|nr:MerR family DNA-binding transcriptional regulator [Patescibacteria group bacterium]